MKKLIIVMLAFMLIGCSSKTENKKTDGTLKETIEWKDDTKNINKFKKYSISSYPDITIGEAIKDKDSEKWEYGKSEKEEYLMCTFKEDKDKNIVIFYKDTYENVNIAEYYVNSKKQKKSKIEEFEKKYFVKEEEINTDNNSSEPVQNETTTQSNSLKGAFEANYMPPEGDYYNSPDGGWPNMCMISIKKTSPNSFQFTIWKVFDENGNSCHIKIFNEHEAIFESYDSRSAIYRGNQYTVYFYCDYFNSFNISGFPPAEQAGDLYSTGSEFFGY